MQHIERVRLAKQLSMSRIHKILNSEIPDDRSFHQPVFIEPAVYIDIGIHYKDHDNRSGYSIKINTENYKPVYAEFYSVEGPGTGREEPLSDEELADLLAYYGVDKMDIYGMCHKIL